jgi:hypothetical protein
MQSAVLQIMAPVVVAAAAFRRVPNFVCCVLRRVANSGVVVSVAKINFLLLLRGLFVCTA